MASLPKLRLVPRGVSARLLALTVAFVMASEVVIFLPSLSRFRIDYLVNRIDAAHLAMFALEATPDKMVSQQLADAILAQVGAHGIVLHRSNNTTLMLDSENPPHIDATYDLRRSGVIMPLIDALMVLGRSDNRVLRVLDTAPKDPHLVVEVLLDERPLRQAMWAFAVRVFGLSLLISLITASLLYVGLRWLLVTPLRRLIASMMAFRDNPEDAARVIVPTARSDELGLAQRELAALQETVRQALRQKERLAALGTAVAKINHDLRNILSTARLVSDGLADSAAPEVRRVTPRLVAAIDRAVALCTRTLTFTREGAPPPQRRRFALADLVAEVAELVERHGEDEFALANDVAPTVTAEADRDQLFRVLHNLALNAAESGARHAVVRAHVSGGVLAIEIGDDGPGLAPKARENLFRPFAGSARPGGAGLGLAIAREVMRAHGGEVALGESTAAGTLFVLRLPAPSAGEDARSSGPAAERVGAERPNPAAAPRGRSRAQRHRE
ncbi:MAG TPA: HAMP domain-containing sensor histidine kinase [Stellaceae bacterium]|nr:HAMP domain-containing sensor histidine kinase [Stellaceae bacterium]